MKIVISTAKHDSSMRRIKGKPNPRHNVEIAWDELYTLMAEELKRIGVKADLSDNRSSNDNPFGDHDTDHKLTVDFHNDNNEMLFILGMDLEELKRKILEIVPKAKVEKSKAGMTIGQLIERNNGDYPLDQNPLEI